MPGREVRARRLVTWGGAAALIGHADLQDVDPRLQGHRHPGRADVIAAGALVLRVVMERSGLATVIASEHDILDGIAWSLA